MFHVRPPYRPVAERQAEIASVLDPTKKPLTSDPSLCMVPVTVNTEYTMKTMLSKYPGTCRACGESINRGEQIAWSKATGAMHLECFHGEQDDAQEYGDDESEDSWPPSRATLESDRRVARQGLSVIRFSSGRVMTQNSHGRCEDAPCCGCCS